MSGVGCENAGLIKQMRDSRATSNVGFIDFSNYRKFFKTHVFCFFEGEDAKYYNLRIKNIIGDNIIPITVGNKENNLKLWRKLKKEEAYKSVTKMFFVDKDMDDMPKDMDKDLYVTPCYSIENLYVDRIVFKNILESEFSINEAENDYMKALDYFDNSFESFCNEMLEFNALVLLRKEKNMNNGRVAINNIKTKNLVSVSLNVVKKSKNYSVTINDLKNQLQTNEFEVERAIERIKRAGDFANVFRGKNQLDFFIAIINILKQANFEETFFEKKRKTVSINLTNNRWDCKIKCVS